MNRSGLCALLAATVVSPGMMHTTSTSRPDLLVSSARVEQTCVGATPVYAVIVTVMNRGAAPSPARFDVPMVAAQDAAKPPLWTGSAGLPALAVNGAAVVNISLAPKQGNAAIAPMQPILVTINGGRWIDESDFNNDTAQATWTSGAVSCTSLSTVSRPPGHMGPIVVNTPTPRPLHLSTQGANIKAIVLPAPGNLTYTTSPKTCTDHSGLAGALICTALIAKAGLLLLVWDWNPSQSVDGFHIYRANAHAFATSLGGHGVPIHVAFQRQLVDTQTDPSVTIRGISPFRQGDCYIVTAYQGALESDPSNQYCVGATAFVNTPVGLRHIDDCYVAFQGSPSLTNQCYGYAGVIPNAHYALTWGWTPCSAPGCLSNIDGYHVYVLAGIGANLIFTQTNVYFDAADGGPWQTGTCYVVTAYRGQTESQGSNPHCVTAPKPTPFPTAPPSKYPMHVVIHITDDTFPDNIDVREGGSVTWINDDNDEHTVTTDPNGSYETTFNGDLLYRQFYTATFPVVTVGGDAQQYIVPYFCKFHSTYLQLNPISGMVGQITAHRY